MAEHEWVNVPEMSEKYVYTLPMPLEQHSAQMINADREAIKPELAAQNERFGAERSKRFEAEAEVRRLHETLLKMSAEHDAGIKQARARDANFELRKEKVLEQEQMIADLQATIAENRAFNEQLDKQRREALNSASAAKADARNGWSAFRSKSAECNTLLAEQERRALDISHLREQLGTERRGHEATKATLTSERARWSQAEQRQESVKRDSELFRKEAGEMRKRMVSAEQQLRDLNSKEVLEEQFRMLASEQQRELAEALNANRDLKDTVSAMMFAHTVLSSELHTKESDVAALQKTVNELDKNVIEELKAELLAQSERFAAERTQRQQAEADGLKLRATLQEMSAEQDYTTKQLRALEAKEHAAQQELRKERGAMPLLDHSIDLKLLLAAQQHVSETSKATKSPDSSGA
jgi:chromosome segregation ATPase